METEKIYKLIDECVKDMLKIEKNFYGYERIKTHEKEERLYKARFEDLNINPSIVSNIYSSRNNNSEIQEIKNSIEKLILKK
ncbi:hypothetical protein GW932_04805 [archaeon]|nr:hypothetical protein [archaeon]